MLPYIGGNLRRKLMRQITIDEDWRKHLTPFLPADYFQQMDKVMTRLYQERIVFPSQENLYRALNELPFDRVKVVILGQDPYHGPGQANGLAFSVAKGHPLPPSLKNIFQELEDDLKIPIPQHGDLSAWVRQGILLLNTSLSVEEGTAHSHKTLGWGKLTKSVLKALNHAKHPVVYILWGRAAQSYAGDIDQDYHYLITSAHPSPLSAYRGFFGSRPFSKTNQILENNHLTPIDWRID